MRFDGFFGGSYEGRAVTADAERTINWYPEKLQSSAAPSQAVLYPTPGVEIIQTVENTPGRAHYATNGREFAVMGTVFYEFSRNGIVQAQALGTTSNDGLPATISSNGDAGGQLLVTAGGNAWCVDLSVSPATAGYITALEGKAHFGGHLDGYFLALDATTSTLYVSNLLDGTVWDTGEDFAQRSLAPDPWRSMKVSGRTVWLFGEKTSEPWFNTGARFPLAPSPTGVIGYGIMAPWSAETLGNDVIWLGTSRDGRVCVLRTSGMDPQVISTYPLETKMQDYRSLTNAIADGYADSGHQFYLLNFDSDNVTWAWDAETGIWCERGTWAPESNRYSSWRPRFYAYAFNEHRMLDTSNGNVYRMASDLVRDVDGRMIRRLRRAPGLRAPGLVDENKRAFYSSFELDLEPGLGEDRGHVSFSMAAQVGSVAGTVADGGSVPVPDAIITVTVDGNDFPTEETTDENGDFIIEGLPVGEVIIYVVGYIGEDRYCGQVTVDNDPVTDVVGQAVLAAPWLPNWCAITSEVGAPALFDVQLVPDDIGTACDDGIEYSWKVWNNSTSEEAPLYTSTEQSPSWLAVPSEGGKASLRVTDPVTGWSHYTGEFEYTDGGMQCPP